MPKIKLTKKHLTQPLIYHPHLQVLGSRLPRQLELEALRVRAETGLRLRKPVHPSGLCPRHDGRVAGDRADAGAAAEGRHRPLQGAKQAM